MANVVYGLPPGDTAKDSKGEEEKMSEKKAKEFRRLEKYVAYLGYRLECLRQEVEGSNSKKHWWERWFR